MTFADTPLGRSLFHTLDLLAERPWSLLAACLLVNALFRPYQGIHHDANLYAFQVQNRVEDGRHDADLFFKHGSQDDYSLFSAVMAPLAGTVGLEAAFFLGYLAGKFLFLFAACRLCFALIGANRLGVLAALFAATDSILFGGKAIFSANEAFLTPRLLADGCVLLALERLIRGRTASAGGLLIIAMAFHPLMAVGGALLAGAWWAVTRLPRPVWIGLSAVGLAAVAGVLLHRPTGIRLFGDLDPEWFTNLERVNQIVMPTKWLVEDYFRIGVGVLIVTGFAWRFPDRSIARLAGLAVIVGAVGLATSTLACRLPYALLLQGQAFRSLWLVQFLQIPCGIWLTRHLWTRGTMTERSLAVATVAGLCLRWWVAPWGCVILALAPWVGLGYLRRTENSNWLPAALFKGVATLTALRLLLVGGYLAATLRQHPGAESPLDWLRLALYVPDQMTLMIAALAVLLALGTRRLAWAVPAALAVQTAYFAIEQSPEYRRQYQPGDRDVALVGDYFRSVGLGQTPTVYWPARKELRDLWLDVGANSYFNMTGNGNSLFRRDNAVELVERIDPVRPFELYHFHLWEQERAPHFNLRLGYEAYFDADLDAPPPEPTRADLVRLCADPDLDWVILAVHFPDLAETTLGRWSVYDARRISPVGRISNPSLPDGLEIPPTADQP